MSKYELMIDEIFEYKSYHYRDGSTLNDLYNVILKKTLPRQHLVIGRKLPHILIDFDYEKIVIYYNNNKSCCILFDEIEKMNFNNMN